MPPLITTLISAPDNSEVIRDLIAQILLTESAEQQVLAAAADPPKDPSLWKLRVFTEASNPFEEWTSFDEPGDSPAFVEPIINICLDAINYEPRTSNVVSRQKAVATYNLDCYGYGVSTETDEGHDPGDVRASFEAQRAVRLVRNILMAGHYTYLGLPRGASQFVWKRWLQNVTLFKPALDQRPVQRVMAARMQFQVEMNETAPQAEGEELEVVNLNVKRKETGEVYLVFQLGEESP